MLVAVLIEGAVQKVHAVSLVKAAEVYIFVDISEGT